MNLKEIAYWLMIIGIIFLGVYLIYYINSESYQCMNDPYKYSIKLLEKANNDNISCVCTEQTKGMSILLTKDGFKLPLV